MMVAGVFRYAGSSRVAAVKPVPGLPARELQVHASIVATLSEG